MEGQRAPLPEAPTPEGRDRERRARRALSGLLLTALLWQALRGAGRLVGAPLRGEGARVESVDLLRDPAWRLTYLPAIGPGRARDIVRYRRRAGALDELEDLLGIPGVGPLTVRRIGHAEGVRAVIGGRSVRSGDATR